MAKPKQYTAQQMIDALRDANGRVYLAAQMLRCSARTIYNYIDNYPTVSQAKEEYEGREIDVVELELIKQIKEGNLGAIIYYLKTRGRSRGWNERIDLNFDVDKINELMAALKTLGQEPSAVFNEIIARAKVKQDAGN